MVLICVEVEGLGLRVRLWLKRLALQSCGALIFPILSSWLAITSSSFSGKLLSLESQASFGLKHAELLTQVGRQGVQTTECTISM